jgi:hypothetical protein
LSVSTTTAAPGQSVTVTVADSPGNPRDWLGLHQSSAANNVYLDWKYSGDNHIHSNYTILDYRNVPEDIVLYFVKCGGLGLLVGWFSCHYGLGVRSSPTEVPQQASKAVYLQARRLKASKARGGPTHPQHRALRPHMVTKFFEFSRRINGFTVGGAGTTKAYGFAVHALVHSVMTSIVLWWESSVYSGALRLSCSIVTSRIGGRGFR